MLPPVASRIFEKTNLSAIAIWMPANGPADSPARCLALIFFEVSKAHLKILSLAPPAAWVLEFAPW